MTPQQTAALWSAALRELADKIFAGQVDPPTSMHLWTQWTDVAHLVAIADGTPPDPYQIRVTESPDRSLGSVTVPVGKPLELLIEWTFQAHLTDDDKATIIEHNEYCVAATELAAPTA